MDLALSTAGRALQAKEGEFTDAFSSPTNSRKRRTTEACRHGGQILVGRGYMRENPVERLYRDLHVDRIREGTSEIQRAMIGGQIKRRGLDLHTGWVDQ